MVYKGRPQKLPDDSAITERQAPLIIISHRYRHDYLMRVSKWRSQSYQGETRQTKP